jgi:hypothetical protein
MATVEDVVNLEYQWVDDPIWDLENTPGFEAYHEELLAFRLKTEADWRRVADEKTQDFAALLGIKDNLALARYLEVLKGRIDKLEGKA